MRIAARLYTEGKSVEEIISIVKKNNLFQYPTERKISQMARTCIKRINALDNPQLVRELANAPIDTAKQINLYAMMRYNGIALEFMVNLIGEKFRQRDYSYTRKDVNLFITQLQEQNNDVAKWTESTITKLKQVMTKCLIETEMLDGVRAKTLNPIYISEELENGIRANND
jgi:hypothetical protein